MSIAEKLTTIAQNQQAVFDAGKQTKFDEVWDSIQDGGNRTNYSNGFANINGSAFYPKYDINVVGPAGNMFHNFNKNCSAPVDLAQRIDERGIKLDLSKATNCMLFFGFANISRVGVIDISNITNFDRYFYANYNLETIDKIIVSDKNTFISANGSSFHQLTALQEISFEGVIGNSLMIKDSTLLSRNSIENIVGCLSDAATGQTLTLSQTAVDNAFAEGEWSALISGKTNWSFSLV